MSQVGRGTRRFGMSRHRFAKRFVVETLEQRELLAVFTVLNTSDNTSDGSLRWAIQQANSDKDPASLINFAIPGTGLQTITPQSALPAITHPTAIDGSTQSGYNGSPLIELDCLALSGSDTGLLITAGNSTLQALAVDDCAAAAIELSSSGSDVIAGCYVGTTPDGSLAKSNDLGILISGSSNNTIGGTGPHDRNLISGNATDGISIVSSSNNLILGNEIGTDITGKYAVPNRNDGIEVTSSSGTTIGGTSAGTGNLISGNTLSGIALDAIPGGSNTAGTLIEGNFIGVDATGGNALANQNDGIVQNGGDKTTIGGTVEGAGNMISGNTNEGISMGTGNDSLVQGNFIGTDVTGKKAVGNRIGLEWTNASSATIGGTTAEARNIISGNTSAGIDSLVIGSGAELIEGNYIGVDVTGVAALPNGGHGVRIAGPTNNTIGGTTPGAGNVISGNGGDGIDFTGGPAGGTVVEGNFIGTDATGTVDLGNAGTGISLGSSQVTIGGTSAGAGNIIAHNKGNVLDSGDGIRLVSNSDQCAILSNSIFDNAGLGINFGSGPTANHPWPPGVTPGSGPNDYQNYPILSSAVSSDGNTTIQGTLNAAASSAFLVQFFSNSTENPSGHGEGQTYLGSTTVTTDNTSNATFGAVLSGVTIPEGSFVTATATDPSGNTSEFSQDVQSRVEVIADLGISGGASVSQAYVGEPVTYHFTITNEGPQTGHNIQFVDTLPAGVNYEGSFTSTPLGTFPVVSGQQIRANLGALTKGSSVTLSFVVQFQASAGSPVTNTATVSTTDVDPNPSNNTAQVTINVSPPVNLKFTQFTAAPNPSQTGSPLSYSIGVINTGPSPATNVTLTSPLAAGVSFVGASVSPIVVTPLSSSGVVGSNVVVNLGTLVPGASATITITVIPSLIGNLPATATLSSSEPDLDPSAETASTTSTILDKVGTIEFSATGYTVPENAGQAVITVDRVNGARGIATVNYTTAAINATPGVDFTPVSGTLVFASGVTSQTITVPVLADPYDDHNELVSVVLSNVQTTETLGNAILGAPNAATLTIEDIDPNYSPLTVTAVQWAGTARSIRQIDVTFNKPLSSSSATNPANYSLVNVGPDGKYGTRDDSAVLLDPPTYNLSNRTVTLTPAHPLPANRFFHLQIRGAAGGGVEDLGSNLLAGDGATAGTDYTAMLAQGTNLRYATPLGDQVSLSITGGGMIEDLLSGTGEGEQLTVVGAVPHRTVLSGSVRKSRTGTGRAYLGPTLYGLGQFGDVRVRMYSPPFQVGQYPFSPGSTASGTLRTLAQPAIITKGSPTGTVRTAAARQRARPMVKLHRELRW